MKFLDRMSYKFRKYTVKNLMLYIVGAMAIVFAADFLLSSFLAANNISASLYEMLSFNRGKILSGEVWRVLSFLLLPPSTSIIFIIFALYFYYIMGVGLESEWGSFKFDLYYLIGVIFAIIAGFICGYGTNEYLNLSLFFAFATIYPEHEILLFFFIPIKIKWLALIDAAFFVISFIFGDTMTRVVILFAVLNYFLFFGKSIYERIRFTVKYRIKRR